MNPQSNSNAGAAVSSPPPTPAGRAALLYLVAKSNTNCRPN